MIRNFIAAIFIVKLRIRPDDIVKPFGWISDDITELPSQPRMCAVLPCHARNFNSRISFKIAALLDLIFHIVHLAVFNGADALLCAGLLRARLLSTGLLRAWFLTGLLRAGILTAGLLRAWLLRTRLKIAGLLRIVLCLGTRPNKRARQYHTHYSEYFSHNDLQNTSKPAQSNTQRLATKTFRILTCFSAQRMCFFN